MVAAMANASRFRWLTLVFSLLGIGWLKLASGRVESLGHYEGGSITWSADKNYPRKVNITVQLNFRHSYSNGYLHEPCTEAAVSTKELLSTEGSIRVDGERVTWANYVCTDYDAEEDWSTGTYTFLHSLAAGQTSVDVNYEECCWLTEIANNGRHVSEGRGWNLASTVDISRRADNQEVNIPPLSVSLPVYRLNKGCQNALYIPVWDIDFDEIRCRWTDRNKGECNRQDGDVCGPLYVDSRKKKTGADLEEDTCKLTFRTKIPVGIYALSVMIEDFAPSNLATPLSKVPLQFLIKVAPNKGACRKPQLIKEHGTCVTIPAGREMRMPVAARSSSAEFEITRIDTINSRGITVSPVQKVDGSDTDFYIMLTWTPTIGQIGHHVVCYRAEEAGRFSSDMACVYINVVDSTLFEPFYVVTAESVPAPGSNISEREIVIAYNKQIVRPTKPGFVSILDAEDEVIFTADTSESDDDGKSLRITLPADLPLATGDVYKIRADAGAVQTTQRCEATLSSTEWRFTWIERNLPGTTRLSGLGSVDCRGNFMQVFISKRLLGVIDPNTMYLNDPTCTGRDHNTTHYVIGTSYNMCNTSIKLDNQLVTFENTAFIPPQPYTTGSEITRDHNIEIHLSCRIHGDSVNYLSFNPNVTTVVYYDEGYEYSKFALDMYDDVRYTMPYNSDNYPVKVQLDHSLYFEARVKCHPERNCALMVNRCWATPTTNPFDVTRFPIIKHGCPYDDTVQFLASPSNSQKRFSFDSFAFVGEHNINGPVYVHCELSMCDVHGADSPCGPVTSDKPAGEPLNTAEGIDCNDRGSNRLPRQAKRDTPAGKSPVSRAHVTTRHARGPRELKTQQFYENTPLGFNADVVEITMLGGILALLLVLISIHCVKWRSASEKANLRV